MALLRYVHRDMLSRVIKRGDYVVWGNGKYNQKMKIGVVTDTTPQQVRIHLPVEDKMTKASPKNMIVITNQIIANQEGNVGANIDMEESRNKES